MEANIGDSVGRVVEGMLRWAAEDPQVREDLALLARYVSERLQAQSYEIDLADVPDDMPSSVERTESAGEDSEVLVAQQVPVRELAKSLTLGQSTPVYVEDVPTHDPGVDAIELVAVEKQCLVKAEAARWAVQRRKHLDAGASYDLEIEPLDSEIIAKGKEAQTFLWMSHPTGPCPDDMTKMDDVANCFETMASAVSLVRSISNGPGEPASEMEDALCLAAEAQCMLRVAVNAVGWQEDREQSTIHAWLRSFTYQKQIFLPQYMKMTDFADPSLWRDLRDRIECLDSRLAAQQSARKKRLNLLGKVRYHAKRIEEEKHADGDWTTIERAVADLIDGGMAPSNLELREILVPVIDGFQRDDVPEAFSLVLREIDRYRANRAEQTDVVPVKELGPDVLQVAELLRGKKVAIVGGDYRPAAHKAIEDAFGLAELKWLKSDAHESVSTFEPHVADPEVALVILMIRWSSHSYAELQGFCDKCGKPLLRLPGGYNPNQIAFQILEQCSDRLA